MPFYQILIILIFTVALDWVILRLWRRWKDSGRSLHFPKINRKIWFLVASLVLLTAAQIVMYQDEPLIRNKSFAIFLEDLNNHIRMDLSNPENHVITILLLVASAIFFSKACISALSIKENKSAIAQIAPEMARHSWITKKYLFAMVAGLIIFIILLIRMFHLKVSLMDPILWVMVLSLTGWIIANREKVISGTLPAWNISHADIAIILTLIAGGLLVSSFRLTSHPAMFMGDEGNFFDTARAITIGEYRPSFFDMGVYSYPIASSYWQGLVMNWFGVSLWSWRFSSVLIGVTAVVPLYLLGLEMFGRRIAILASISFLTAPYFLAFARLGYNNSQVLLPVTLCAWMLYRGWKNRSTFSIFLGGLAAGLGYLTYTAARIALIIGLAVLAVSVFRSITIRAHRPNLKTYSTLLLVFILGWFIAASPHLVFSFITDSQTFRYKTLESIFINVDAARLFFPPGEIYSLSPGWQVEPYHLYFNPEIYAWLFQRGFLRTTLSFFLPGLVSDHFVTSPLPGAIPSTFLLCGIIASFSRIREKRNFLLLTWFFLVFILLSTMNTYPPRQTHMVPVIPVMALLTAVGINTLVETIIDIIKPELRFIPRQLLAAILGLLVVSAGLYQYFVVIPRVFKPNLDQVMNWAQMSNDDNVPFVYITNRENWKNWKPFALGRFTPYRSFWVITEEELLQERYTLPRFSDVVYIFHANKFEQIVEKISLDFHFNGAAVQIFDSSGSVIGGMAVKGLFDWPVENTFSGEISILMLSPAGYISLILFIAAILLYHKQLKHRMEEPKNIHDS